MLFLCIVGLQAAFIDERRRQVAELEADMNVFEILLQKVPHLQGVLEGDEGAARIQGGDDGGDDFLPVFRCEHGKGQARYDAVNLGQTAAVENIGQVLCFAAYDGMGIEEL